METTGPGSPKPILQRSKTMFPDQSHLLLEIRPFADVCTKIVAKGRYKKKKFNEESKKKTEISRSQKRGSPSRGMPQPLRSGTSLSLHTVFKQTHVPLCCI
jgi:hypothetical protein